MIVSAKVASRRYGLLAIGISVALVFWVVVDLALSVVGFGSSEKLKLAITAVLAVIFKNLGR